MAYKPPFWLPIKQGGDLWPEPIWQPPLYRFRVDTSSPDWDATQDPVPAANAILDHYHADISNFVQAQRMNRDSGIIDIVRRFYNLPGLTAEYRSEQGREIVDITVSPTATSGSTGNYVLVQVTGPQNSSGSGPNGTFFSFSLDPINGTEVPATISLGELMQGAKVVYKKIDVTVTTIPNYYCYLAQPASAQFSSAANGGTVGSTYDAASMQAFLLASSPLPGTTTVQVGYNQSVNGYSGGPFSGVHQGSANTMANFSPGTSNTNLASIFNAGGSAFELGGTGGYSVPSASFAGPYADYDMTLWYAPWLAGVANYYTASLTATWVIKLPEIAGKLTKPAFAIDTTGYGFNATISIFPSKGISVDKTSPSFPLKWSSGKPPSAAGGGPWSPFGTPDTNVQDAYLWQIYYQDLNGTAQATSYPFVVTNEKHLVSGSTTPHDPSYKNIIVQMYPTFINPANPFSHPPGDGQWGVNRYADVAYGRLFAPTSSPPEWDFSLAPGPLPLISTDTPA